MRRACIVILFLLVGCGGGSSGGDPAADPYTGSSPVITGLEVFLISDPGTHRTSFVEGDIISGYLHVSDPDMDLIYAHALEYYPATAADPYGEQFDWELSEQTHADMVYLSLDAFELTGPAGTWRIDFQIEDLAGNLSNVYPYVYSIVAAEEEDDGSGEPPVLPIPIITAEDITATGTSERIILSWNVPYDYWLAYYEILRSSTPLVGDAVVIGSTISMVYSDPVGPKKTYYYWIRIIQKTEAGGEVGDLPEEGKEAHTVAEP